MRLFCYYTIKSRTVVVLQKIRADPFRNSRNMRSALRICGAVGKGEAVETTAGCMLHRKINIAVLVINGEAWYNVTTISAYQSE